MMDDPGQTSAHTVGGNSLKKVAQKEREIKAELHGHKKSDDQQEDDRSCQCLLCRLSLIAVLVPKLLLTQKSPGVRVAAFEAIEKEEAAGNKKPKPKRKP